jgi:hypothetical protein
MTSPLFAVGGSIAVHMSREVAQPPEAAGRLVDPTAVAREVLFTEHGLEDEADAAAMIAIDVPSEHDLMLAAAEDLIDGHDRLLRAVGAQHPPVRVIACVMLARGR